MIKITKCNNRGVTLIEVIVVIVVAAMVAGAMIVYTQVMTKRHINERRIAASNIARQILEHETLKPFDEIVAIPLTGVGDAGHAYTNPNAADLSFEVAVTCLQEDFAEDDLDQWLTEICGGASEYKRVDVAVSSPEINTLTFRTFVAAVDGF